MFIPDVKMGLIVENFRHSYFLSYKDDEKVLFKNKNSFHVDGGYYLTLHFDADTINIFDSTNILTDVFIP